MAANVKDVQQEAAKETRENVEPPEDLSLTLVPDEELLSPFRKTAVIARFVGVKSLSMPIIRSHLNRIWHTSGPWRISELHSGTLAIWFDNEYDCSFVLERRPWYVHGGLLNIREMPDDGEWTTDVFRLAIFWVRVHELPHPYLTEANAERIAAKIGLYRGLEKKKKEAMVRQGFLRMRVDVLLDHPFQSGFFLNLPIGKKRWIQFKYENPPKICFKCGVFNHEAKNYKVDTSLVCPPTGKAVPMYGPWIRVDSDIATCFSRFGEVATDDTNRLFRKLSVQSKEGNIASSSSTKHKLPSPDFRRAGGNFDHAVDTQHGIPVEVSDEPTRAGLPEDFQIPNLSDEVAALTDPLDKDQSSFVDGDLIGNSDRDSSRLFEVAANLVSNDKLAQKILVGKKKLDPTVKSNPGSSWASQPLQIGNSLSESVCLDVASVSETLLVPDHGPTLPEMLELPHENVCFSRTPHKFPETVAVLWPNQAQGKKVLKFLTGPDIKAQQTLVSYKDKCTEVQYQVQGSNKRKAPVLVYPDLVGEALQTFLAATDEVKCDEIAKAFQEEILRGNGNEVTPTNAPARKTRRFSFGKEGRITGEKFKSPQSREESSCLAHTIINSVPTSMNDVNQMGEEAALIKPLMGQ